MSTTTTTRSVQRTATLYLAFELGKCSWRLGFSTGPAQKPRQRTISARDGGAVLREIERAAGALRAGERWAHGQLLRSRSRRLLACPAAEIRRQKLATDRRISSAVLVQMNGFGSSLFTAVK